MSRSPISPVLLERYVLGEVSDAQRAEVEAELARDPALVIRIKELREDSRRILSDYPPRMVALAVEKRVGAKRVGGRQQYLWLGLSSALVAAVAVIVVVQTGLFENSNRPAIGVESPARQVVKREMDLEKTRLKGDARLMVYRLQNQESVELVDEAEAMAGDVIQLKILAGNAVHGVVFSVDGRGAVTLHFPVDMGADTLLDPRGGQPLARAYELDDAPDFERFFFVTGEEPLSIEAVLGAGEALGTAAGEGVGLPGDWHYVDFMLRKTEGVR
jgi:anti-sigma-K factor RskA